MGLERLLMILENLNLYLGEPEVPVIYIAPASKEEAAFTFVLTNKLRAQGLSADTDLVGRSLKAQMKYADKRGYKYVAVVGSEERESGKLKIKRMSDGAVTETGFDAIAEVLR